MTVVDIANMALTHVGAEAVLVTMNDMTKEARLCSQNYDLARRAVLAGAMWKFALTRAKIDRDTTEDPAFGFSARFQIPQDYIRALTVNGNHTGWVREGVYLLCNEAGPINLRYIYDNTLTEQFDPLFADCVALDLATRICYSLTQSDDRAETIKKDLVMKTRKARHTDSCDQGLQHIEATDFEEARISAPRGFPCVPDVDFPPET